MRKLSILIPSIPERTGIRNRLLNDLFKQIDDLKVQDEVQVLLHIDDGIKSIGTKRNELLKNAESEYIAFVDDDDRVSPNYVALLLGAISTNPDCVNLIGELTTNGRNPQTFTHSIEFDGWYEKDKILYRYTNHLNCIKTEIAQQIGFPEWNFKEDQDYSTRLQQSGLLKVEHHISEVLYYYDYITHK